MVTATQLQILQSPITGLISSVSTSVSVKLDDSNYLQWHFQIKLMLEGYGIMDFVDGTNMCPPQFSSSSSNDLEVTSTGSGARVESDLYKVWKMHDRALMQLITVTLSPMAISCAIGSSSARDLWVRLQEQFSTVSKTSIFQLKSDLQTIKKGADSVSQYLQRIKETRDYLAAAGVTFVDEDIVILALNGLPAEYNTFRCVIRGRESVISLKEFRAQLLAEEATIENNSCVSFPTAMMVKNQASNSGASSSSYQRSFSNGFHNSNGFHGNSGQSSFYNGGNKSKFKGKGKATYNQGHKFGLNQGQKFYHSKPIVHDFAPGILGSPSHVNNGTSSSNVICQICSQHGHSAATCVYRSDESSENCQICDRSNHTAKTCFYRNKGRNSSSQMTAMNTVFPGSMQPQYMSVMPPMMNMGSSHMSPMSTMNSVVPSMNASSSYAMPTMSSAMTNQVPSQVWLTDSGATNHMTNELSNLSIASPYSQNDRVQTATGEGQSHRENLV